MSMRKFVGESRFRHVEMAHPSGYPKHREVDVALRDGSTIHVRPVLPSDLNDVQELVEAISEESSELRFRGVRTPLTSGRNVAILSNAGGLGILCADACEAAGLSVPELTLHAVGALEGLLPPEASAGNPVDMIASATAEQYGEALRILLGDPSVHAVIAIFIPPLVTRAEDVAAELMKVASEKKEKLLLGCFLSVHGIHESLTEKDTVIPTHAFPESAAKALGSVARLRRMEGTRSWVQS